jgi:hypothetical protein
MVPSRIRQENKETANHPCSASPKGRHKSLVCFQKTRTKAPNAVRRSIHNRNYITGKICRQKGRSTNTDCQDAPTHQLSSVKRQLEQQESIVQKTKERRQGNRIGGRQ